MDAPTRLYREKTAEHLIKMLAKRRIDATYASTGQEAKEAVLGLIPSPASVIRCGSESAAQLGLWDAVATLPGVSLLNPYAKGLSPAESVEIRRQGMLADVMISSTNAITLDGRLVNLDGMGNRVAAMTFGPKKVIILAGMNKVAPDLDTAMARVKHLAAPVNSLRLAGLVPSHSPPCVADGRCHMCMHEDKICYFWTITEGQRIKGRMHVVLCGEDLGY